jgi:glucose/arabinose dehydrogenase
LFEGIKAVLRNILIFAFFSISGTALAADPAAVPVPAPAAVGVNEAMPVDAHLGLRLPAGFKATVFADKIGRVRHIVAADNGWLYGALMRPNKRMGAVAMRDADGDGIAEDVVYFAKSLKGTGIGIYDGYLYYGTDVSIIRWQLPASGAPTGDPELIAYGFGERRQHAAKSFTFDGKGGLYVNVGAPSNACMEKARSKGSKGMDPCPILEEFGGIWKFDATKTMQQQDKEGIRYATGIRNAVALDWNMRADSLYIIPHGRDQLGEFFPELFTPAESAELPSEEFHKVAEGADMGWPYSYYDHHKGQRMVMPEYGGDGKTVSDKGQKPLVGFPAHWAPNDLMFLKTDKMPEAYRTGAFIGFHGSWNRAPLQQQGYRIAYVPMDAAGNVTGDWITFADGFAGTDVIKSPRDAKHRPMGLAEDANGAMYVSSLMSGGRVWKITYEGD